MLCSWLSNSPNYEEITKWYLGWKSMFSDQVLAHPSIKDKFNEALDIMNRAVSSSVGRWLIVVYLLSSFVSNGAAFFPVHAQIQFGTTSGPVTLATAL